MLRKGKKPGAAGSGSLQLIGFPVTPKSAGDSKASASNLLCYFSRLYLLRRETVPTHFQAFLTDTHDLQLAVIYSVNRVHHTGPGISSDSRVETPTGHLWVCPWIFSGLFRSMWGPPLCRITSATPTVIPSKLPLLTPLLRAWVFFF